MLIGAHESVAGGLELAFQRGEEHHAQAIQIFTKSSRSWASPPLEERTRRAFRKEARRSGLRAFAHGSYLTNLAADEPRVRRRSLECLADELRRANRLGLEQLVVHPGCHSDEKRGIRLIAEAIDQVHAEVGRPRTRICLEVTAGQGNSIGWRFEQIAGILSAVGSPSRLGVCLDTCHLFAAGYDISHRRGYEAVVAELDRIVGAERVRCLHLNDCKKPLGCRVDRHEEIGKGTLGLKPFGFFVNDERWSNALAVLETPFPERYGIAIRRLRALEKKATASHAW